MIILYIKIIFFSVVHLQPRLRPRHPHLVHQKTKLKKLQNPLLFVGQVKPLPRLISPKSQLPRLSLISLQRRKNLKSLLKNLLKNLLLLTLMKIIVMPDQVVNRNKNLKLLKINLPMIMGKK